MKHVTLRNAYACFLTLLFMTMGVGHVFAQHYMNIRFNDGNLVRYPVNTIDSVWYDIDEPRPFTLEGGYIFYKTGKQYSSASWQCSDYILIDPNRHYYLNIPLPGYNAGIAFYDANKKYISGVNIIADNRITSPPGTCYLRFSTPNSFAEEVLLYLLVEKIPYSLVSGYIYYKTGKQYNSASWQCSDYITTSFNKKYYLNIPLPGYNAGIAYYNADKRYLTGSNTIADNLITIPEGGAFLKFSTPSASSEGILFYSLEKLSKDREIPFTLDSGYIIYKNGVQYNSSSWKCTNFISVEANKEYHLNIPLPGYNAGYAFYDSNQKYISGANTITDNVIRSPKGTSYIRFSIPNTFTGKVLFYALEEGGSSTSSDTNGEQHNDDYLIIKNNNQDQINALPNGSFLLSARGDSINLNSNYGKSNQVLAIPVRHTVDKTMVVRFRVKFNDDLTKRSSEIDYGAENPNLLNFFTMSKGKNKVRLGVLPDNFKNPDIKKGFESYGQCIGMQGTTMIKAVNANNTSNTDLARVTALTFDNYRFKSLTGGRLFSVRWIENTPDNADVCMSNDGNMLKIFHSSSNSVITSYTLSGYATINELGDALRGNSNIDVKIYEGNKTPKDMIEFADIKLVSQRNVVDGAGIGGVTYPTKTVYDNAPIYIMDKIDDGWHTVEIAADRELNSGVFCCCVDGVYLYAGDNPERISYYDGDTVTFYFGGDENGTKVNCSIKDVEIKYDNTEDTEIVCYSRTNRIQIISDWHPKVFVLEGHKFSDTDLGGQSYDRMDSIFQTLIDKGYKPITLNELQEWVVNGNAKYKRMFYAIYDDYQYAIYLNPQLNNLHKKYNAYFGLAEITSRNTFEYEGTTYAVSDLNDSMINENWTPLTHTRHQVHNTLGYDDLVKAFNNHKKDLNDYHIPQIGLVWPGGQSNIMCHELVKEYGWSMAFDICRNSGYYAAITDGVKRCDKTTNLPRLCVSNRFQINTILQEIR